MLLANGFFELTGATPYGGLTEVQVDMIKEHLNLVFNKVTGTKDDDSYCDTAPIMREAARYFPSSDIPICSKLCDYVKYDGTKVSC